MVIYSIEHLVETLKKARQAKGLSQRALGKKVGVPQSHISKIESGLVDLQASSLIEIARSLELEPILVPRPLIPLVQSLLRNSGKSDKPRPMYKPDEDEE